MRDQAERFAGEPLRAAFPADARLCASVRVRCAEQSSARCATLETRDDHRARVRRAIRTIPIGPWLDNRVPFVASLSQY